jgi:hypothetical protein
MTTHDHIERSIPDRKDGPGRRLRAMLTGFGALHALNALVNMGYTFLQLFVFARTLPTDRYATVVFLTSIGFFVLPISQAIGRANFTVLRPVVVQGGQARPHDEIALAINLQAVLLLLLAAGIPLQTAADAPTYAEDALYLLFCFFTNFWYFELQSTVWAVDLSKEFERLSLTRRLVNFASLGLLLATGDFLVFGLFTLAINTAFFLLLRRMVRRRTAVVPTFPDFRRLDGATVADYARHWRTALMSTLSELVILSAPYGLFTAVFGVGPAVVLFDTAMKLTRLSTMVSRNLSEIALPRVSRLNIGGERRAARRTFLVIVGLSVAGSLALAAFVALAGPLVFSVLLGPNNVMPEGSALVAAGLVLASGFYQPAVFFIGFMSARGSVGWLVASAAGGFAALSAAVWFGGLDPLAALAAYAVYFGAVSLIALVLADRAILRSPS